MICHALAELLVNCSDQSISLSHSFCYGWWRRSRHGRKIKSLPKWLQPHTSPLGASLFEECISPSVAECNSSFYSKNTEKYQITAGKGPNYKMPER